MLLHVTRKIAVGDYVFAGRELVALVGIDARRPDLFARLALTDEDRALLAAADAESPAR